MTVCMAPPGVVRYYKLRTLCLVFYQKVYCFGLMEASDPGQVSGLMFITTPGPLPLLKPHSHCTCTERCPSFCLDLSGDLELHYFACLLALVCLILSSTPILPNSRLFFLPRKASPPKPNLLPLHNLTPTHPQASIYSRPLLQRDLS